MGLLKTLGLREPKRSVNNQVIEEQQALQEQQFQFNIAQAQQAYAMQQQMLAEEAERRASISNAVGKINSMYGSLGANMAKRYADAYREYYLPQVGEQYAEKTTDMRYGLGDAGGLRSSFAALDAAKLAKERERRESEVRANSEAAGKDAAMQIAGIQQALINSAMASEDPSGVLAMASRQRSTLGRVTPTFSPLGALFANIASNYGAYRRGADLAEVEAETSGIPAPGLPDGSGRTIA